MSGQRRTSTVDVDDRAFRAGLERAFRRMELDSEKGLQRVGLKVQRAAKELCPVDTGRLRSSIALAPGRDRRGPYVDVGTNVVYALPVEFGSHGRPGQPFMRPALAEAAGYTGPTIAGRA